MSYLKSEAEIAKMAKAGAIAAQAMAEVAKNIRPGIKSIDLDKIVQTTIEGLGAESSFKKVDGYQHTTCITPNDWVVHGIPGDYLLKNGDIMGVDLGAYWQGFHSDMAHTFPVGSIAEPLKYFLSTGEEALGEAIKQLQIGFHIGDISETIQTIVEGAGFSVVRELVGHGVGRQLHEEPFVPGRGKKGTGPLIEEGMVLAVEIIYTQGSHKIKLLSDGWSIATADGSFAGLFERTVAVTKTGPVVLTKHPSFG